MSLDWHDLSCTIRSTKRRFCQYEGNQSAPSVSLATLCRIFVVLHALSAQNDGNGKISIIASYTFSDSTTRHPCTAQIRLESHFYVSQETTAGKHYVLLQFACLSGMMTQGLSDVNGILGPFCDQVWVSITPTASTSKLCALLNDASPCFCLYH